MKVAPLVIALGLLSGCATLEMPSGEFMDLASVSTEPGFVAPATPGPVLGPAKERYCAEGEAALKRVGYVDHLVAQALEREHADYVTDAKFRFVDKNCVEMVGELRLKASEATALEGSATPVVARMPAARPLPGMEIVGQRDGLSEISNSESLPLTVGQVFEVIDGAGSPRGEVKVEKLTGTGAWASVSRGKAFYGWKLVQPTTAAFAKPPTMPNDPANSAQAPAAGNPLRFEINP